MVAPWRQAIREWLARFAGTFRPLRSDADLEAELQSHLQLAEDAAPGASRGDSHRARRDARLKAGGTVPAVEALRDQRGLPWLADFARDLRYGTRLMLRQPGFGVIAAASLALGIGANAAAFSWADAILLRPLPVPRAADVLTVGVPGLDATDPLTMSYREFTDVRTLASSFSGLAAFAETDAALAMTPGGMPEPSLGLLVSDNFFEVLQVPPPIGRGFRREEAGEPGRDAVVVLSHDAWTRRFGSDPNAIGRVIGLNGVPLTIIGVAPPAFLGVDLFNRYEFFVPVTMWPRLRTGLPADVFEARNARRLLVRGRLREGVTLDQARLELARLGGDLARAYPATNRDKTFIVRTELASRMAESPVNVSLSLLLTALAVTVLLTACANVSGLLVSRAPTRAREVALRLAVGANRSHVVRQLLTEAAVIGIAACGLGLVVARAAVWLFRQFRVPTDLPVAVDFDLDSRVVAVSVATALGSTLLVSLAPAIGAARTSLTDAMKAGTRAAGERRLLPLGAWLVGGQVMFAIVLLTIATFIVRDLNGRLARGPGIVTEGRLMMWFNPDLIATPAAEAQAFYRALVEGARALPGVRAATVTSMVPTDGGVASLQAAPEGADLREGVEGADLYAASVDEAYFETLGVPVLEGRPFAVTDNAEAPRVAIVNQTVAERFWPGRSAVGASIRLGGSAGPLVEIVGVVRSGQYTFLIEPALPLVYFPREQRPVSRMALVLSAAGPAALAAPVRELVARLDGRQPIYNLRTLAEQYRMRVVVILEILKTVVTAIGGLGFGLALVGLYGLVAYGVSRRTREIGIRVAVGAAPGTVLRMVMRQSAVVTAVAIAAGVPAGLAAARAIGAALPGGSAPGRADLTVFTAVIVAALGVALLSAYLPARRALRVEPTEALRAE
jgi:predicted permease